MSMLHFYGIAFGFMIGILITNIIAAINKNANNINIGGIIISSAAAGFWLAEILIYMR